MRLDSHQHYWSMERNDYGWIVPELHVLYKDYLPFHMKPNLEKHSLEGTIVVQAAPTLAETDYLLKLSEGESSIKGVVAWLDLTDPLYATHYDRLTKYSKLVGFRIMIQEMDDANCILEPSFVKALTYFRDKGTPVDLLLVSDQLEPVITLLDQIPGLHAVIDHIAKPGIKNKITEPWKSQMNRIAAHSNIYCKISGMVTEADHSQWNKEDFVVYVRHVLNVFGPKRIMFGSDWPVCLLAASYDEVVEILEYALPDNFSKSDRERLFGLNAKEFYKL